MSGVRITKDQVPAVLAAIKALVNDRVLVGIPAENAARPPDPDDPHSTITNAMIGYLNETGAPEINLPARPHLVPGIQRVLPKIEAAYRAAATKAINGDIGAIARGEAAVGTIAKLSVQNLIAEGLSPALSDRTMEERKKRGVTRSNPLQDTGEYRNQITYVIRPAKNVKRIGS